MIREAIDKILSLAPPAIIDIGDRKYSDDPLRPITEPVADTLIIHTLTGLVDYVKDNLLKDLSGNDFFVHVASPSEVNLYSSLFGPFSQRKHFLHVTLAESDPYPFGRWLDIETFIIQIQAKFVPDDMTMAILKLLSNIKEETVKTSQDDGFSQSVKAKAGIALVEEVKVPNPVSLRPYRTFLEVEQPASPFVLRLKTVNGELNISLHDADGGLWKLEAIQDIKQFLEKEVAAMSVEVPIIA